MISLLLPNHQVVLDRFVTASQADSRVIAAFLGGSHAKGTSDKYSDLDLYLITTDEAHQDFLAGRKKFIRLLGEPLFLEDFGLPQAIFYIFSNGTEGELWVGSESHFQNIHGGPYKVLLDKKGVLVNAFFPNLEADPAKQIETLRQQITWFWHELAHFTKAMGRGQLWFAYGQLVVMRHICVNLARMKYNFSDPAVGEEPYFKVDQALPIEQLSSLKETYCPMEYKAMLQAAFVIFRYYQGLAPILANSHGIKYQMELERMMMHQLEKLDKASLI